MSRLILISSSGLNMMGSDPVEIVIPFVHRFVWGPLPSPGELANYLAVRSDEHNPGLTLGRLCRPMA